MAIHPSEANNHKKSLLTVINKQRNVGFFGGANISDRQLLNSTGLPTIEIGVNDAVVFYNKGFEREAQQLASIAKRNGGFLPTNNPEETHQIGILLGYDPASVKDFVNNKWPNAMMFEKIQPMKKKLIINERQYKAILDHMAESKVKTGELINEGSKELILGAALIISQAIGKSLSNFNKEIGEKAISNPSTMANIKAAFEDDYKLDKLASDFETIGMVDPSVILAANAHKVVDEFNRVATERKLPHMLDVDVINRFKSLNPVKKA